MAKAMTAVRRLQVDHMAKATTPVRRLQVQPTRSSSRKTKTKISPLARMLSSGGIVYAPIRPYLKRLQSLYKAGNFKAHSNLLYPGLAHVLTAREDQLANSFVAILGTSNLGEHLDGLESLFVSCLHGLQTSGRFALCKIGIGAWARHRNKKSKRPLVFVDRRTNELKYVHKAAVNAVLSAATPARLTKATFGDILRDVERAVEAAPAGFINKAEQVDAADCKDKVTAWVGVASVALNAASAAAQSQISDKPTASAVGQWGTLIISAGAAAGTV